MSHSLRVTPKDAATIDICLNKTVTFTGETPFDLTDIKDKVKSAADRQWADIRETAQLHRQKSGEWLGLTQI